MLAAAGTLNKVGGSHEAQKQCHKTSLRPEVQLGPNQLHCKTETFTTFSDMMKNRKEDPLARTETGPSLVSASKQEGITLHTSTCIDPASLWTSLPP